MRRVGEWIRMCSSLNEGSQQHSLEPHAQSAQYQTNVKNTVRLSGSGSGVVSQFVNVRKIVAEDLLDNRRE